MSDTAMDEREFLRHLEDATEMYGMEERSWTAEPMLRLTVPPGSGNFESSCGMCPIIAVDCMRRGGKRSANTVWRTTAKRLGLPSDLARRIVNAADRNYGRTANAPMRETEALAVKMRDAMRRGEGKRRKTL